MEGEVVPGQLQLIDVDTWPRLSRAVTRFGVRTRFSPIVNAVSAVDKGGWSY